MTLVDTLSTAPTVYTWGEVGLAFVILAVALAIALGLEFRAREREEEGMRQDHSSRDGE